jgi:hypothetical protein
MNANICAICLLFLSINCDGNPDKPTRGPEGAGLKFQAYDGDPRIPEKMDFQLTRPAGGRTEFVKIGDLVNGTNLRVESFQFKEVKRADGKREDASELTLRDGVTRKAVVLQLQKVIDLK